MSANHNLSDRHQNIFKATVQHYIATAEPVGSKTLAEEFNLSVSSATIRNAMGSLEKAGLLYQPHTSAGRIPSDSGYRLYVDRLITPDPKIAKQLEQSLNHNSNWETGNYEFILQRATQILATLSGYIALVTLPQNSNNCLRHIQLVQVSAKQVMLIIVTDAYQTQSLSIDSSRLVGDREETDPDLIEEELQILSNFLNSKLKGRSLSELVNLDWQEIDREFTNYADFLRGLLRELHQLSKPSQSTPIMVRGVSEVLRQPEFSQMQQVQMLLHLLEQEQQQLWQLVFELPDFDCPGQSATRNLTSKKVTVKIGAENMLEPMRICTLVTANYYRDDIAVGSVGIIGPTRMLYENAIALVESTADYLSEALS
jgi:heat-inducible transcriptional repressor